MLIQGFNTFLPPGYRIECGTDDNPDAIRVTTPSGTMTQSLQSRGRGFEPSSLNPMNQSSLSRQDAFGEGRRGWSQPLEENATSLTQQEQRGVSSLQNAVSAAQNGTRPPMAVSPGPGQSVYSQQAGD